MQMASMQSQQAIGKALGGSVQVMQALNADMDVAQIRDVMKSFAKEMAKAEGKQEMMDDAFDMMDGTGVAEDADAVYDGILGEIGLEMNMNNQVEQKKI